MYIDVQGRKIFYTDQGSGDQTLVFVHGWMASNVVWREQVEQFAKSMRVVTFDLTGYGRSDKPDLAYTSDLWLKDIDVLISLLGLEKPTLIGWSMGGAIAITYAVTRSQALSRLVIVGSTPLLVAERDKFPYGVPPEVAEQLAIALEENFCQTARGFAEKMFPEDGMEALKNELHAISQLTTPAIAIQSIANTGAADLRPFLDKIEIPTLIMHGEADAVCPVEAGYCLFEQISDAQIHTFLGKGHLPFMTANEEFNQRLQKFLVSA